MARVVVEAVICARLRGRKITDVFLNSFDDGKGGRAFDPEIVLDDGTSIVFSVSETEVGDYGVNLLLKGVPR